jgi:hypothetical protein
MFSRFRVVLGVAIFTALFVFFLTEQGSARRGRRNMMRTGASTAPASFIGTATFGHPWTWTWDARRCTDGLPFSQAPFDPGADAGFSDVYLGFNDASQIGTDANYVCDRTTGGLNEVGLGTALMNQGLSLNGASWVNAALGIPGWVADRNSVIRVIYQHDAAASGTGRFFRMVAGAAFLELQVTATNSLALQLSSTNVYAPSVVPATPALVAGQMYLVDIYLQDAATVNPRAEWFVNGSYIGSTNAAAQPNTIASFTSGGIGSTQTGASVLSGRTVVYMAFSNDPDSWYDYETHMTDCRALGLCPTAPSAGCGRTPPCAADAGTPAGTNIVCGAVTLTAGGISRQHQLIVPTGYDRNTPMTHVRKRCGAGTNMFGCLTADPQIEARAAYIVSVPEPRVITADVPAQAQCQRSVPTDPINNLDLAHEIAMIRYVEENYCVDRTWYFGRSNGAMCGHWVSSNLGNEHIACMTDTIGYMPVAPDINTMHVNPARTPVVIMHNTPDPTVAVGFARDACRWYRGVNDGTRDGGPCVATDGGRFDAETYVDGQVVVGVDGSVITGCGPGAVQSGYNADGGAACVGGVCCTFYVANDAGPVTRYCECPFGGHTPNLMDEQIAHSFCQDFSQPNNR